MTVTLDLLFPHLDDLIQTPADVQRLNEAILQLAVQGKLVPQDPHDEPAEELLKQVEAEKKQLIVQGKLRKTATFMEVNPPESPFLLPEGWVWSRVGTIGITQTGTTPPTNQPEFFGSQYPFIKPADISGNSVLSVNYSNDGLSKLGLESGRTIEAGSALMVCIGGSIGKVGYTDRICSCNQQINAITPYLGIDGILIAYFMMSPYFQGQVLSIAPQTTLPILSKGKWELIPIPLPPLAEQKRIVAKVDELFAQTRALEAKLRRAQEAIVVVNRAVLHHLHHAADNATFQHAAQILGDHFDLLYTDPSPVTDLRQTILQLAVQGKLVPQDPHDEPAGALLKRIAAENEKADRMKPLLPLSEEQIPFAAPAGWAWAKMSELAHIVSGVTKGRNLTNQNTISVPYLRVANVQRGYLDLSEIKYIDIKADELDKYLLQDGDLLLTEGGDADKVGRSAIWRNEISGCIHQNHIFRARPVLQELSVDWLTLCTNSQYGRDYFLESSKQTTNLASINSTQLKNFPVPLPPLAEQKRIVAKVDELLARCAALERKLGQAQAAGRQLTAAVLHGVVG